jgi:TolB-like protein
VAESPTADPTLRAGETLYAGRYRIEGEVGRGGMGVVYRAVDVLVGDTVALKVLDGAATPQQLEWFRREVRLARKISHPNVARTHDMGEHAGVPYLSMEFVEGATLHELLRQHAEGLPAPRAAKIVVAVCDALAAAHAAGVVHRDLKPANILIERDGRVVLTDFGIARPLADDARTVGVHGTPLYMAPEQLTGRPVDARTDLYAVGLTLHELLTGAPPFSGDNALAAALTRLHHKPVDILSVRPDAPEALVQLVRRCLAVEPEDRPSGAAALADELREWLLAIGDTASGAGASPGHREHATSAGTLAPTLAVLPFRYQGPPATNYLADAVCDDLIDVLSRTRGVRVIGSGATARYRDARDPRALGTDLGAALVVDATLQVGTNQVRVQARLIDVHSGVQSWNERFEVRGDDLLESQDILGKRIAEALRIELMTIAHRGAAPPEAVALYLRARRKLAGGHVVGPDSAVELLEECLRAAPRFRPAIALFAVATARAYFFSERAFADRDWLAVARAAVARAVETAPDLAETHFARATLAVQDGAFTEAVRGFVKATEAAPTFAHAHEYLSQLQCEGGNIDDGVERARLAVAIDPSLVLAMLQVARVSALRGDLDAWTRTLARFEGHPHFQFPALIARARVAAWYGDHEQIREVVRRSHGAALGPNRLAVTFVTGSLLGEYSREQIREQVDRLLSFGQSPRLSTTTCQVAAEVFAQRGYLDDALDMLERAVQLRLIDVDWLERCPALAPLRDQPRFIKVRRQLAERVQAMWIV